MARRVVLLLVAVCITIVLPTPVISDPVNRPFHVKGRVYCDTCRAGFETNVTSYIQGARVRIQCKDRNNLERVFSIEGVTDSTGTYDILVHNDHQDQICESVFVSSPQEDCKTPDPGRSRSTIVLTRSNNGILSQIHYANSLGCLKDEPLALCHQLLKYYLSDV